MFEYLEASKVSSPQLETHVWKIIGQFGSHDPVNPETLRVLTSHSKSFAATYRAYCQVPDYVFKLI